MTGPAPGCCASKLRQGSYFPEWLLERRRRAEQAPIPVVATSCLLGVSTRRVEKLAERLGITSLSDSAWPRVRQAADARLALRPPGSSWACGTSPAQG